MLCWCVCVCVCVCVCGVCVCVPAFVPCTVCCVRMLTIARGRCMLSAVFRTHTPTCTRTCAHTYTQDGESVCVSLAHAALMPCIPILKAREYVCVCALRVLAFVCVVFGLSVVLNNCQFCTQRSLAQLHLKLAIKTSTLRTPIPNCADRKQQSCQSARTHASLMNTHSHTDQKMGILQQPQSECWRQSFVFQLHTKHGKK